MGDINFNYYYGKEADQFSFYRVPRLLIKDEHFKGLSSDAKLLYGLMLDRMSMSMKNEWFDDQNRAYIIYTLDNVMDDLGCGKDKAVKVLKELDDKTGIGLIEKVRQGLGKPDIIYVKNFCISDDAKSEGKGNREKTEVQKSEKPTSGNDLNHEENDDNPIKIIENPRKDSENHKNDDENWTECEERHDKTTPEVGKAEFQKSEKPTSRLLKNSIQEVGKADTNYNNNNYMDLSNNNHNQINLIYPSKEKEGQMDRMSDVRIYMEIIKENICYDDYMRTARKDRRELFEEVYNTIVDIVCVQRENVRIDKIDYPYELVKSRFLKLNSYHVDYVIGKISKRLNRIENMRGYMISTLYNATTTMNIETTQEVEYDLHGGGMYEKSVI